MPTPGSPTVRRRRLAAELRRLRLQSDQTAEAVANLLGWSKAKVSRYELAQSGLKPSDVESLLDVYGVRGERRAQLLTLAREATERGWWEAYSDVLGEEYLAYIALEAEATSVLQFHINVVPGLLQTEQYARDVISGLRAVRQIPPALIERQVETRMIRQQVLTRDQPLQLAVVLDESVLRRQRGNHALMYVQLQRLVKVSEWPNIRLHICPLAGPKRLVVDSFTLFQFGPERETSLHDVVSTENLSNYLYVEGETDTYEFEQAFEQLVRESLDTEESREFILRTARQLWPLQPGLNKNRHSTEDAVRSGCKGVSMNDSRRGEDRAGDGEGNCARSGSWRKSFFSMSQDCIEVAILSDAHVGVRDSKVTAGPHLRFPLDAWATFLGDVRATASKGDDSIRLQRSGADDVRYCCLRAPGGHARSLYVGDRGFERAWYESHAFDRPLMSVRDGCLPGSITGHLCCS